MTRSATPPTEPMPGPDTGIHARSPSRPRPRIRCAAPAPAGSGSLCVGLGVVLLLLIIFIAQNTQTVNVSFFGWDGQAPLAVTLLIATAAGLFLAAVAGSLRILQLRRRVRREKRR